MTPAATPEAAAAHFAGRLAYEADAADVGAAVAAGELDFALLDVRSRTAHAAGHIPGALRLPHAEIDRAAAEALPAGLLVVYCWGPRLPTGPATRAAGSRRSGGTSRR